MEAAAQAPPPPPRWGIGASHEVQTRPLNVLFIGHPKTGHRSVVIYTLIESCKRHGIEPQAYLTDILKKLQTMNQPRGGRADSGQVEGSGQLIRQRLTLNLHRRATPDAYIIEALFRVNRGFLPLFTRFNFILIPCPTVN